MTRGQKVFALVSLFVFLLGISLYGTLAWKCKDWFTHPDCQNGGCLDANRAENCEIKECAPDRLPVDCRVY
jgi:hypothetical protein